MSDAEASSKVPRLRIGTWNLRVLAQPGYSPWPDQPSYPKDVYGAKLLFLSERLVSMNCDIVGLQEIAQAEAFEDLFELVKGTYPHSVLGEKGGGSGLRVGFLSKHPVLHSESHVAPPPEGLLRLEPDGDPILESFRRPILGASFQVAGKVLTLLSVHLKAKRPDFFDSEPTPERGGGPVDLTRAIGRSLITRAAESVGLRALTGKLLKEKAGEVVLLGDFNDGPQSLTTQMLGRAPERENPFRQDEFYSTYQIFRSRLPYQDIHTHIWENAPEILDHIVVSGRLARRFLGLRVYNDFLADSPFDPSLSDHGALIADFQSE